MFDTESILNTATVTGPTWDERTARNLRAAGLGMRNAGDTIEAIDPATGALQFYVPPGISPSELASILAYGRKQRDIGAVEAREALKGELLDTVGMMGRPEPARTPMADPAQVWRVRHGRTGQLWSRQAGWVWPGTPGELEATRYSASEKAGGVPLMCGAYADWQAA